MDTLGKRIALYFRKLKENKALSMRFHKFEALFLGGVSLGPACSPCVMAGGAWASSIPRERGCGPFGAIGYNSV